MPSTLRFGDKGLKVAALVKLLTRHGCTPRPPVTSSEPRFGRAVENMVLYFQMTHQGLDGNWLDVDGVVGKGTWWALNNATGQAQRSFLDAGIPKGISGQRRVLLETAVREHGVREDPNRPNRGSEVDKYLPREVSASASNPGPPWCCYFVSWVLRKVFGKHLLGRPVASVHTAWQHAVQRNRWGPKDDRGMTPGDAFVILHSDPSQGWCTGHIGFVLQVACDGKSYNTVEGNCGNRVKIGHRDLGDPLLRGFINIIGDSPDFECGSLRGAKNLGTQGTR